MYDTFHIDNVTKEDMKNLAQQISQYLNELERSMIIPEELMDEYGNEIKEGIKRTKKLIKKLKDGDKSVFKDFD